MTTAAHTGFAGDEHETDVNKAEQYRARAELAEVRLEQVQDMITALASNEEHGEILKGFVGSLLRTAVGASGALLVIEPASRDATSGLFEGFARSECRCHRRRPSRWRCRNGQI